jgi:hypothetical protein
MGGVNIPALGDATARPLRKSAYDLGQVGQAIG